MRPFNYNNNTRLEINIRKYTSYLLIDKDETF